MSNIGLMEGAYFVGRKEVMDWVNSTTDLNLAKIEDTASGAVACQLLDIMYPGQVPMHKVNWAAKQNFEFVANYKILQTCFTKLHIDRHIDVDRLISGRYMDNLEFMQWFKRFFELSGVSKADYDATAVRAKGKGANAVPNATAGAGKATILGGAAPSATSAASASAAAPTAALKQQTLRAPAPAKKAAAPAVGAPAAVSRPQKENKAPEAAAPSMGKLAKSVSTSSSAASTGASAAAAANAAEMATLRQEKDAAVHSMAELRLEMDGLEKERDFYFDKLRDIEILLQENEDAGKTALTDAVFKILYATAEGFEQIETTAPAEQDGALAEDLMKTKDGVLSFPLESVEEETY